MTELPLHRAIDISARMPTNANAAIEGRSSLTLGPCVCVCVRGI